jgi:glycosyltransferase involved in cell wall biosynthesis
MPTVSVIIAALQAHEFLGEALDSVLAQTFSDFEILVAPDESADYSAFADRDPRVRILPGVGVPTGPGPARNRALAQARGEWLALLDADDLWSRNYLATLLPLAEAHHATGDGRIGAAFGRTEIEPMSQPSKPENDYKRRETRPPVIRSVPPEGSVGAACFAWFEQAYASFHGIARRTTMRRNRVWRNIFAEDVLFDAETLALAGGEAPFSGEAIYRLRLRPTSISRSSTFIRSIADEYDAIIAMIQGEETEIPPRSRADAIRLFESWKRMNARYLEAKNLSPALEYQNFVSSLSL